MTADQQERLREKTQELINWERKLVTAKTEADLLQYHINFYQKHIERLELEIQSVLHDEPKMPVIEVPEASLAEEGASLN